MQIRIGGVPEHFNYPWQIAISQGSFSNIGIDVEWQFVDGGTGEMNRMLRENELDLAIGLTEGIVADIVIGNPSLIVQKYIKSPLIWGIHTGVNSGLTSIDNLSERRFAISRFGSGSHIMASVLAKHEGIVLRDDQFILCGNFEGAKTALNEGNADYLLWEKFTTLPDVKNGSLRRLGETITPWPCFVIAAREEILLKNPDMVWNLLWVLRKTCRHFMHDDEAESLIAKNFNLELTDAHSWFNQTEWEQDVYISRKMLNNVVNTLHDVGSINRKVQAEDLCWNRVMVY